MPFSPKDLQENTRIALDAKFKVASQKIDIALHQAYNGVSLHNIRIKAEIGWTEPGLFEVIKSNYATYGWSVELKTESGDQRDPYTIHYLVFSERHDNRDSVVGGYRDR